MNNSKYKPEYCDMLKEHMRAGFSYKSFAAIIGVNPTTLFAWEDIDEWAEAKQIASNLCLLYWEKVGIDITTGKLRGGNILGWQFNMKNRFSEDWRDKQVVENENPSLTQIAVVYPQQLPPPPEHNIIEIEAKKEGEKSGEISSDKPDPVPKNTNENG